MGKPEHAIDNNTSELVAKIEAAQAKITKLTASITNLYDMAEAGDAEAKDRIKARKLEKAEAEQELTIMKGQRVERANIPAIVSDITQEFSGAAAVIDIGTPVLEKLSDNAIRIKLRSALPSIFEKVVFDTTARTVEAVLKEGVNTGTYFKDVAGFIRIPRSPHSKK
jgi:hypothetical protein